MGTPLGARRGTPVCGRTLGRGCDNCGIHTQISRTYGQGYGGQTYPDPWMKINEGSSVIETTKERDLDPRQKWDLSRRSPSSYLDEE